MKLEQVTYKIKCDMPGCRNLSSYALTNRKFLRSTNIHMCTDCMKELYKSMAKVIVPKSPKNILNKVK